MAIKSLEGHGPGCSSHLKGLQDALEILKGKWKVLVIGSLSLNGKRRFPVVGVCKCQLLKAF